MRRSLRSSLALVLCFCMAFSSFSVDVVQASYGRTEGGYAGGMLGAVGGAAAGNAIVAAAGIANPLLATGIIATAAVGTGLAGTRAGSWVGNKIDKRFSPEQVWTVVGGVTGALLGVILGPAGSVIGKIAGAAIGAAVGGWLGNTFSDKADEDFNPRTVGALMGAINGAVLGGPIGAVAGITAGYAGGHLLDKYIMVEPSDHDGSWGYTSPSGISTDNNDDGIPDWYPEWYVAKYYDEDGNYTGGYDENGYDRMGFDEDGYDKQGFDRFGYNEDDVDRQGYDKRGFKVADAYESEDNSHDDDCDCEECTGEHGDDCDCEDCNDSHDDDCDCEECTGEHGDDCDCDDCNDDDDDCDCGEDDCRFCGKDCNDYDSVYYDKCLYNWYWKTWSWLGGGYPEFDDCHWDHFPKALRKEMKLRYKAGHHRRMKLIMSADYEGSECLSDLRDEYNESIRQFREAVTTDDATREEKRVLMHRMMELERELGKAIRSSRQ